MSKYSGECDSDTDVRPATKVIDARQMVYARIAEHERHIASLHFLLKHLPEAFWQHPNSLDVVSRLK